jgi:glycosyltransferase involved in cell wall biosynthesis
MDTYPESAFAKIPEWAAAFVGTPLLFIDKTNALQASKVVTVSENMRKTYESTRGVPAHKLEVVRTWQDEEPFVRQFDRRATAKRYNVEPDRFCFAYLGNIGAVAGVEHLIRSFGKAKLNGAQLLIIGQGSRKEACVQLAGQTKARIQFLSDPEVANVPMLQSLADVCLLPLKRGAAFSSIPSKLSAYMLSGKPVLASVDTGSDSAELIRTARCGWVVDPEDVGALSQKMGELHSWDATALATTGTNGRAYALTNLSKTRGVKKLAGVILEAAGQPRE